MNFHRTWLYSQFELTRLFATKRGWLAVTAFSLVWFMVLRYPIYNAVPFLNSPEFEGLVSQLAGTIGLNSLVTWPEAELAIFWVIALFTFPMFALFVTADQTVEDRNRGTVRFLTLRSTRFELLLGRFLGQVMILAALIGLVSIATLVMMGMRETDLVASGLVKSAAIWVKLLVTCLPFIALMSLLNLVTNSARMSIVFAILFFTIIASSITYIGDEYPIFAWLNYLIPGHHISDITGWQSNANFSLLLPILQAAALLGAAQFILRERDL
ncbi:ABC transporter permease subunit [Pseudoalteromonas luteoviolacea]|uniref:ABC transporter permease subunit n=1 Tax=Pseudoalteromonas luteoviolacea TaxID=43657 RepID=UPI001B36E69C|nr:ABC transporter permease subunit [Pseudoalteromonas luteoviolacea]MBQ4810086.1 ABC transporter permease subunit [Pseudoalteromonas luteoviolacea]